MLNSVVKSQKQTHTHDTNDTGRNLLFNGPHFGNFGKRGGAPSDASVLGVATVYFPAGLDKVNVFFNTSNFDH